MSTPQVTIEGLSFPLKNAEWRITSGVVAPLQRIRVPNAIAAQLMASFAGKETTITIDQTTIKRAILLGNGPANDLWDQLLVFTDPRWYWTRRWLVLDGNEKQRIGDTIVINGVAAPALVVPSVRYRPSTLNDGKPYDWDSFVKRALTLSQDVDGRTSIAWVIDEGGLPIGPMTIEEATTDAPMPTGLARALSQIPGRSLSCDLDGVIHVIDAVPGHEKKMIDALRSGFRGHAHGDMTWIDNTGIRPANGFRVFSTPELEVRLRYDPTATVAPDDPFLEPVFQVPDLTLSVPAVTPYNARTVGMNSWILPAEAYPAWGKFPLGFTLSDDAVREGYLTGGLELNFVYVSPGVADLPSARRIQTVRRCWRRFYRINPRFWSRVLSARPVMSAIWDTSTGMRAASPVYVNAAKRYEVRWLANHGAMSFNDPVSYPTSGLVKDGLPQKCTLRFEDDEQGIVEIRPDTRDGTFSEMAPSQSTSTASFDPSVSPLLQAATWSTLMLVPESQHKVMTIVSMIPAAPDDVRRLYYLDVSLADAAAALGITTTLSATGPRQELRTHGATARFAWGDDSVTSNAIVNGFFGANGPDAPLFNVDPPITARSITPINLESEIRPLSNAFAGAALYPMLDHYEGHLEVPMDPAISVIGSVTEVVHRLEMNRSVSIVQADPIRISTPDPFQLLPASARKILLQLVSEARS